MFFFKLTTCCNFSAMYGKAIIHLIRISAIISCLETAFEIVSNIEIENKLILSIDLEEKIMKIYETQFTNKDFYITVENLTAAKLLVEYFILNRLILAGYPCAMNFESNFENIQSILNKFKETAIAETINIKLVKNVLLMPGEEIESLDIIYDKKGNSKEIVTAFEYLQSKKLGFYIETPSLRGPTKKSFKKILIDKIEKNNDLIATLEELDIDLSSYKKQLNAPKKGILINFCLNFYKIYVELR
jgi:hypothetical protein